VVHAGLSELWLQLNQSGPLEEMLFSIYLNNKWLSVHGLTEIKDVMEDGTTGPLTGPSKTALDLLLTTHTLLLISAHADK